ncbi:TIGR03943 family protein [Clostridium malenominatum]|uniref:TIGR03943 family protein n=1 Tax=Clostridium malenominatum TaxID=1539 RepID=A0ABN1ISL5_9CLOT
MKRFNFHELVWFIILSGFTFYFYYLFYTGKIAMYIAPRMMLYVKFSVGVFLILSLYQFTKIFTVQTRNKINKSYILLWTTLVIGMTSSQMELTSSIADKRGVNININRSVSMGTSNEDIYDEVLIEFNDDNYLERLYSIEENIEKYKGKRVCISGFVFKDKGLNQGEFVVGRMVMTCCAADSQIIGLVSKWEESENLKTDEWVRIEGVIESILYKEPSGKEIELPAIKVEKLEKIDRPDNVYIYF